MDLTKKFFILAQVRQREPIEECAINVFIDKETCYGAEGASRAVALELILALQASGQRASVDAELAKTLATMFNTK